MTLDDLFHNAYKADANYTPTLTDVRCRNCGTRLKVYYCEGRLYAVKCGFCETVTLVKADNPTQAMRYVGGYHTAEMAAEMVDEEVTYWMPLPEEPKEE